mgnify:CR=1 FL=1
MSYAHDLEQIIQTFCVEVAKKYKLDHKEI